MDTNVYIHALQGNIVAQDYIVEADILNMPIIVLGELEYGFRKSARYINNRKALDKFLRGPNINVAHSSQKIIESYGLN